MKVNDGIPDEWHIVPTGDLRDHDAEKTCWCKPQLDFDRDDVWIHNSLDGREDFETGKRKPS